MKVVKIVFIILALVFISLAATADEPTPIGTKVIALGPVDVGNFSIGGDKPADTSETIQFMMKSELGGKYTIITVNPLAETQVPTLPLDRVPTQKEMNDYMKAMRQMSGQERAHKPVDAAYYVDFKVRTETGASSTSGVTSTIGSMTGIDLSPASMSSETTTIYLICDMRDPRSGELLDRYTAKASSVEMTEVGGYYHYGTSGGYEKTQNLFRRAVKKCAGWLEKKIGK